MNEKKFNESIVNLYNQKILNITGVESVNTMNENQIVLVACSKKMCITGSNLEVEKVDVENGILKVKGNINGIVYTQKKETFLKRIFK